MNVRSPIPNEDLCALMDGECSPAERARLEARLADAHTCFERLAAWRRNDTALRFALSAAGEPQRPRPAAVPAVGRLHSGDGAADAATPLSVLAPSAEPERATDAANGRRAIGFPRDPALAALAAGSGAALAALALFALFGQ